MIRIFGWNARSLRRKQHDLTAFIIRHRPDIFYIFEPWLDADFTTVSIPGYIAYCFPHSGGYSGIVLLVRRWLIHALYPLATDTESAFDTASLLRCVRVQLGGTSLLVGGFYAHPQATARDWKQLSSAFAQLVASGEPVFLVSDANAHHTKWGCRAVSTAGRRLDQLLSDHLLHVLNPTLAPGRHTHHGGDHAADSTIDLAIASQPQLVRSLAVVDGELDSDHSAVGIFLIKHFAQAMPQSASAPHTRWRLESANWSTFSTALAFLLTEWFYTYQPLLKPANLSTALPCDLAGCARDTLEDAWSALKQVILVAASSTVGKKLVRPGSKHWWSHPGIRPAHRAYRSARRAFLRHRRSVACRESYKTARRAWKVAVDVAKRASMDSLVAHLCSDPTHRLLFSFLRHSRNPDTARPPLQVRSATGTLPTSTAESLDNLAAFFAATLAAPTADGHCRATDALVRETLAAEAADPTRTPALDHLWSTDDVALQCAKLRARSSIDPQDIAPLFISHAPLELHMALALLFNYSWAAGYVCADWRVARGTPLFKGKGKDSSLADSYRLVSITSIVVRVFERLIFNRLFSFLDNKRFFDPFQFGFRPGCSTYDAIFLLHHSASAALAHHSSLPTAFLDIKKAFDSVWHEGLLYKLYKAGARGRCLRWAAAFLRDRHFFLVNNGQSSPFHPASAGVPQGSVLSTLFFTVFINDLPPSIRAVNCMASLFADDISVWPKDSGEQGMLQLARALAACTAWAFEWRLHFSNKCVLLIFSLRRSRPVIRELVVDNVVLAVVNQYVYLGIIFTSSLSWHAHFSSLASRLASTAGAICSLLFSAHAPPAATVRRLVVSLLYSRVAYAFGMLAPSAQELQRLQSIILRPLRRALALHPRVHQLSVLVEYGLPSLPAYHAFLQLRTAARFNSLPITSPTHDLFAYQFLLARGLSQYEIYKYHNALLIRHASIPPIMSTLRLARSALQWLVDVRHSLSAMHIRLPAAGDPPLRSTLALITTHRAWLSSGGGGAIISFIRAIFYAPSNFSYLFLEPAPVQRLRARLRLNASALNAPLHRRCPRLAPSPSCVHCSLQLARTTPETVPHVLLVCSCYAAARDTFVEEVERLLRRPCQPTIALILDPLSLPGLSKNTRIDLLRITSKFISAIHDIRGL